MVAATGEARLNGITKRFSIRVVVNDMSLTVLTEEAVVLLSPSDSGKTTVLRLVLGPP